MHTTADSARLLRLILLFILTLSAARAAELRGTVLDPSGAAIAGAQVSAVNRVGVVAQATTDGAGAFVLRVADTAGVRVVVTAPGFATETVSPAEALAVRMAIAPQVDSVSVAGSAIDAPMSEQGSSAAVVTREEIAQRNEPMAADLLRYLPGLALAQSGQRGSNASLYLRGGDSNFTLVQIDGVTVNAFGGEFDFANIPADWLERVEVVRGPQSAVYGAYAISGAVNMVTRPAPETPSFDFTVEGGSHDERRFSAGGGGTLAGFGISGAASRLDGDGAVSNAGYRNENAALGLTRNFARQGFGVRGNFNSNEAGAPGPWGSDPLGLFTGIDRVTRDRNNFSNYLARYWADLTPRIRQEISGSFFLDNNYFKSPYGDSYNQDRRAHGEACTLASVTRRYIAAFGFAWVREDEENSWITDSGFSIAPLRRDQQGLYLENRVQFGQSVFVNAGVRGEFIRTAALPANEGSSRPDMPRHGITKVNPKVAAAWAARAGTRLHASFGTGIRPPGGFDLAFTNNPALRPERTASFDAGIEQRLLGNHLAVEATWFYNRFTDLIVSLGGSLARLSSYRSDNLANSRAQGAEVVARWQPGRTLSVTGTYTLLKSEILSLDGSSGLAPAYFRVGQQLLRRPEHSGTLVGSFARGRLSANLTGYFRGSALDVEPNWGASAGLFRNPGYLNAGFNLNYRAAPGVTVYGHLRNAFNRRYEEVYGYPAPLLNFVAGMKFSVGGRR